VSLRIVATPLHLPAVAQRAAAEPAVRDWYGGGFGASDWEARAAAARSGAGKDWFDALKPAIEPHGAAHDRLARAVHGGIVVTTGQQPGLFGGPLYTWHKALTALALADELQGRLGIPVAPLFWAATDDSDLAEATVTTVSVAGGAQTIVLRATAERDTPMSAVPIGDATTAMTELFAACGSAPNPAVLEIVRSAYSPGNTLGSAYVLTLRALLEPLGIAVLDAAHPAARTAGAAVTRAALQKAHAIAAGLRNRERAMSALGLRPQVRQVAGRTLVFSVNGTRRQRVRIGDALSAAERSQPHELSPNVLLRPIVERCIVPTVAYVGGPSEVAYFAQVSAVAEALGIAAPHIVPRWSGFVVEPHVQRALDELGADIDDLREPHALEGRIARAELPADVLAALNAAAEHVHELAPAVLSAARSAELPIPDAAVHGAVRQLDHRLERLHRRLVAAVKRRGSDRLELLATTRGALFPRDLPQERALNMVPLLARYGDEPLTAVLAAARGYVAGL
jgi:bacillithiol synthase